MPQLSANTPRQLASRYRLIASRTTSLTRRVAALCDPLDRFGGLVVDTEVDPLGMAGPSGQRGPAGMPTCQRRRVTGGRKPYREAGRLGSRHPSMNACPLAMALRTIAATTTTVKMKPPRFLSSVSVKDGNATRATTTPTASDSQKDRLGAGIHRGTVKV